MIKNSSEIQKSRCPVNYLHFLYPILSLPNSYLFFKFILFVSYERCVILSFVVSTIVFIFRMILMVFVRISEANPDDIYYHRECLVKSLENRSVDLITISSHHGITPNREPRLKGLFPDTNTPRSYAFKGKKVSYFLIILDCEYLNMANQ